MRVLFSACDIICKESILTFAWNLSVTLGASLESRDEFELVGSLLGLAIYNGIILDAHFPTAIYKKLHQEKMDLQDLLEVQPSLGNGLKELLEYEGDVENTFCQTFQV